MALYQKCSTLSGKYLRRGQRHKRLRDNEQTIDHLRFLFQLTLDHLDYLNVEEHRLTEDDLNVQLDFLWGNLRLIAEHQKRILS